MDIEFYLPKKISANSIYSGVHWTKRGKQVKLFRDVNFVAPPPVKEYPVKCHYHFELKGRKLDISNCFYMVKLIEDCLVRKGVLIDDTQKYVSEITVTASKGNDVCKINIEGC